MWSLYLPLCVHARSYDFTNTIAQLRQSTHFYFISQKLLADLDHLLACWFSYWSSCSLTEDWFNCWSCKHDAFMKTSVPLVSFICYSSELYAAARIVPYRYHCHSLTICTQFIVLFFFRLYIKNPPFFPSVYVSFVAILVIHFNNLNLNNIQQLNASANLRPKGDYSFNSQKGTQIWIHSVSVRVPSSGQTLAGVDF